MNEKKIARRRLLTQMGGAGVGIGALAAAQSPAGHQALQLDGRALVKALSLRYASEPMTQTAEVLAFAEEALDPIHEAGTTIRVTLGIGFTNTTGVGSARIGLRIGGTLGGNDGEHLDDATVENPHGYRGATISSTYTFEEVGPNAKVRSTLVATSDDVQVFHRTNTLSTNSLQPLPLKITGVAYNTTIGVYLHSALVEVIRPSGSLAPGN